MTGYSIAAPERSIEDLRIDLASVSEEDCLVAGSRDHQDDRQMG
jgi:hypothetical protein